MNYAALKAEIALPAYDGLTDAQIAAALNAQAVAVHRDAPAAEVERVLLRTTEWGRVVRVADGRLTKPEAVADICITLVRTVERGGEIASASDVDFALLQNMVGLLVQAEVISTATRDALLALRATTTSRAAQLGLGVVAAGHVQMARAS